MANKIFKGVKFPGMDDYYVLPEAVITKNEDGIIEIESYMPGESNIVIDKTLSASGAVAEAKAVGDALQNKVSVVEGSRLMTAEEANKLAKLVIDESGNVGSTDIINVSNAEGILTIEHGGTGNTTGYIQTGAQNGSSIGNKSTIEGANNIGSGESSHVEGVSNTASGDYSHAEGHRTQATGTYSHAEGSGEIAIYDTRMWGSVSLATYIPSEANLEGCNVKIVDVNDPANVVTAQIEAFNNDAVDWQLSYESIDTSMWGSEYAYYDTPVNIFIEANSTASGVAAHAEGVSTTASGTAAHAEGYLTKADYGAAHAEGDYTRASGYAAHAEGSSTQATAKTAHAEGSSTQATAETAHAEGEGTVAASASQHVQGKCNIIDSVDTYAHIVGNGTYSQRSNAHTLDWDGNAWFAGAIDCEDVVTTLDNLGALNLAHVPDGDTDHLIPENADLNDYITPGAYRCATSAIAKTLSNMTSYTSAGFRLIVSGTSTGNGSVQFIIFNSGVGRLWFRIRTGVDTWGDWKRILTSDDTTGSGSSTDLSDLTEQIESKLEMKLLWTNASYTSSFAAQTIKISRLSDYDLVFIVAIVQTTNTARVAPVLVKVPTGTGAYLHVATGAGAGLMTATREVVEITSSTIEFDDAVYSNAIGSTATTNNYYCIPYKVYGLKGVQ